MKTLQLYESASGRTQLRGVEVPSPMYCEYFGVLDGIDPQARADLVQAVNTYNQHIAVLEDTQQALALFNIASALDLPSDILRKFVKLEHDVKATLEQHQAYLAKAPK